MNMLRIAIDGPSSAGKSTMAKLLSEKLNIDYIDTGAMYRAFALKILRSGTDCGDDAALAELLAGTDVDYRGGKVFLDGEDVSGFIRTPQVTEMASVSSAKPQVRAKLTATQQQMGRTRSLIMDGRDIGTTVLPDAEVKFFLNASPRMRAMRRALEYASKGLPCDVDQVQADIEARDYRDSHREASPLRKAEGAVEIDTSDMTVEQVVNLMLKYIDEI